MQHLAEILFVQMGNLTLLRRDAYLDHLKQGIKPDTWCALRNSPPNSSGLFPDDMVRRAEEEIAKSETECRATQPGSGHGGYGSRKQNRYQPYQSGWNRSQDTNRAAPSAQDSKSQHGAPLAEIVIGAGVEVPPLEVATPRLSREIIIKNDNYCVSFVPNQDP